MEKGSWKYSVVKAKCPRCQEGDVWEVRKLYSKKFSAMKDRCSVCDLKYTIEQGFWYGAMYVSYAFGVAITVTVVALLTLITDFNVFEKTGVAVIFLIAFMPPVFRYSRIIWINLFVHFDKKYLQK